MFMNYKKLFNSLLTEQALPVSPNSTTPSRGGEYDVPSDAMGNFLDQGTDPDEFLTKGIQDTFSSVQKHFDSKMSNFSSSLSPESIKGMTLSEIKDKVGEVYDFANKIEVFSKSKIDSMAQDPYAIMAGFVASEPTKLAAFKELHKTLSDFQQLFEDIDAAVSSVHSKIDEFVSDINQNSEMSQPQRPERRPM
jgi:hypothetical protein